MRLNPFGQPFGKRPGADDPQVSDRLHERLGRRREPPASGDEHPPVARSEPPRRPLEAHPASLVRRPKEGAAEPDHEGGAARMADHEVLREPNGAAHRGETLSRAFPEGDDPPQARSIRRDRGGRAGQDAHQDAGEDAADGPVSPSSLRADLWNHDHGRPEVAPAPAEPARPEPWGADDVDEAPPARPPAPQPSAEAIDDLAPDEFDEIAVTIGRVVSIRGSVIWGALYDDADGTTARAARMGALVSMRGPESRLFGIVNALEREQQASQNQAERTIFEIQVLGEVSTVNPRDQATGFQRGVSSYPPLDAPITTVTLHDLATVYARPRMSNVHIGRLRHNHKVPAFVLTDSLLGKHFAVLGTTGTGKSCAVTVILRSILDEHPNGHVVLIDPHNEYATAFTDKAELLNPSNLQLPYWLLNFEEIAHILIGDTGNEQAFSQTAILKDAIYRAKRTFAGEDTEYITVDTPVPYRLSDLIATLKDGMGMLNKPERTGPYLNLIARIESLRIDKRFAFMFASISVRDVMSQVLAQLLRIPVGGKPITIIDISGMPSEIVDVVVSVLFRLIFELAVWSERRAAPPVLLVCEEAHRYVPQHDGAGFAPTKRVISRIAKEGRKYGVTLCLVSQRPSEVSIDSLAQCNTMFALRLCNEHDQKFVARALSENARWLVDGLPSLNTQEAVVVGDGVTVPVHIRFNDLPPEHRPSGGDPSFSSSWRAEADPAFLDRAIDRWRRQAR